MQRFRLRYDTTVWTRNLILFAITLFLHPLWSGAAGRHAHEFLHRDPGSDRGPGPVVGRCQGVTRSRTHLPRCAHDAAPADAPGTLALFLDGRRLLRARFRGVLFALLLAVVAGSFGFHLWAPLNSAIGLALSNKQNAGYVLGALTSVGSLAGIAGMGAISLISGLLPSMPLTTYYVAGGIVIVVSSFLLYLLPKHLGTTENEPSRILIKGRHWRYYVLIFFSERGSWSWAASSR